MSLEIIQNMKKRALVYEPKCPPTFAGRMRGDFKRHKTFVNVLNAIKRSSMSRNSTIRL